MQYTLLLIHVIVGVLFIVFVLIQDKGVGVGAALGGGGGGGGFYATQRGAARVIHLITVFLCFIFVFFAVLYAVAPSDPVLNSLPSSSTSPISVSPTSAIPAPAPTPASDQPDAAQ